MERCSIPEHGLEQLLRTRRGQWVEPELTIVGLAPPHVLVLGAIIYQEEQPGGGEALDQAVEQDLRLRIDPMQIFKNQEQRLDLGFPEQHPLERGEGLLATLEWIKL